LLVSALLYRHWLADKERRPAGKNSVTYDHASLSKQMEKNETEDKLANPSSPEKWPLKLGYQYVGHSK